MNIPFRARLAMLGSLVMFACSSGVSSPSAGGGNGGLTGVNGGARADGTQSGGTRGDSTQSGGTRGDSTQSGGTRGDSTQSGGASSVAGATNGGGWSTTAGTSGLAGESTSGGAGSGGAAVGGTAGLPSSGSGGAGAISKGISVQGQQLLVDGKPYHIRGVCWNPVPKGKTHPAGLDFRAAAAMDIPLMQRASINTVRTYEPLTDVAVLDQLHAAGIRVLNSVYVYGGDATSVVADRVNPIKDHPAILAWLVGNEWNYNGLYVDLPAAEAQARLNDAAKRIRALDQSHPIAAVYGELPSKALIDAMPDIAIWGINSYRGIDFGDMFSKWRGLSSKPMFLAEYGADAYNATSGRYDPESQAKAVTELTRQIADNGSAFAAGKVAVGGTIFEWADEWWKDGTGDVNAQDIGGVAPGGGPYPDQTFNEEWWGLVEIDRKPRAAYDALKAVFEELPK